MEAFREPDTEGDLELEGLAAVAQARLPGLGELSRFGEGPNDGDDVIPPFVARDEAERREDPGRVGNEHGRGAELVGESARVQRPGAAERDEGEVAAGRGPFSTETTRRARSISALTISTTAAGSMSPSALSAAATSSSSPPGKTAGSRPRSRFASVTVAAAPPLP